MTAPGTPRAHAIALVGTTLVVLYAAFAALQILVLNPLAAVPGRSLAEIQADMAAAGEPTGAVPAFIVLGIGVALALAFLVVVFWRGEARPGAALLGYALLLACGAPAYFFASFGAGMSLADTYGISGGDHAPWAKVLYVVSAAALVVGAVSAARGTRRRGLEAA